MTEEEYQGLRERAVSLLKEIRAFPVDEFSEEAKKHSGDERLRGKIWAAYLEIGD